MDSEGRGFDGRVGQLPLWSRDLVDRHWKVRVSRRARRMTIRVFAGGRVEIVVPRSARPGAIERFVAHHRDWIERKVAELSSRAPPPNELPDRIELAAMGETWLIRWRGGEGVPRVASSEAGTIEISGDRNRAGDVRDALRQWLIDQARERLAPLLEATARETSTQYDRMQVRRQRTRWGSCSRRGTISLNCCLLFQHPSVVRYLVVHELCHTLHMNHSSRFWRAVAEFEPDYRRLDRELVRGWQHVPSWVFGS